MARRASERFVAPEGTQEAPPDTSRGRLWPWIVDVWRGGLQNGSNQGNTNLFYICVKRLFRSISTDFRDRFDRAAVFTKIVI